MLLDLRSLLEAAAFSGVGATSQASQTEAAQGLLRFIGQGADSQAAQSESATGLERFIGSSVTTQSTQSEAATGSLRFIASAVTAQASQSTAGSGLEKFVATAVTAQATQVTAGTGQTFSGFAGIGATTQVPQITLAEGATPTLGGGLLSRQWKRRFVPFLEEPVIVIPTLRGTGGTQQQPQSMSASGEMREDEDWLLAA